MWTPLELAILMYPHYSIVPLQRSRDVLAHLPFNPRRN